MTIKKTRKGYKVISHTTGKSFGTYSSLAKAKQRLKQIKYFGGNT
jgi:hypothetical protein